MWCPTENLGPIGSAVLTFIGFKQTDTQAKFMYRQIKSSHLCLGVCLFVRSYIMNPLTDFLQILIV